MSASPPFLRHPLGAPAASVRRFVADAGAGARNMDTYAIGLVFAAVGVVLYVSDPAVWEHPAETLADLLSAAWTAVRRYLGF